MIHSAEIDEDMLEISQYEDVTRFELARSLPGRWRYWTVAYHVDGLMVDTGCAHTAAELVAALMDRPLHRIVNTHAHEDHIGGNGLLQNLHRTLEFHAHPLALPTMNNPRGTLSLHPYRRLFWGWPAPSYGSPLAEGVRIETEHHAFEVIHTPGHSPDHLCLYEPDRGWLFTGDLFAGGRDRALCVDYDLWQIIASLKKIATLTADKLFPGCARVRGDPAKELATKIAYLEEMGGRVLCLHKQGWGVDKIARKLLGGPLPVEFITLGHFSRRGMVRAFLK